MLSNKQKKIYVLIGTAMGLIAGIYHLTLKEIIDHEIGTDPSRNIDELEEKVEVGSKKA